MKKILVLMLACTSIGLIAMQRHDQVNVEISNQTSADIILADGEKRITLPAYTDTTVLLNAGHMSRPGKTITIQTNQGLFKLMWAQDPLTLRGNIILRNFASILVSRLSGTLKDPIVDPIIIFEDGKDPVIKERMKQ